MKARVVDFWEDNLHSSYWFIPSIMAGLAVVLSFLTISLDKRVDSGTVNALGWVYTGGPDGASTLLSAIAGSVITVAGITFSLMITALTLAASQFGSRLLRGFMRDTSTQIVLGTFTATFIYCLLTLRAIHSEEGSVFVPHFAVTVSLGLAVISLGVLIYFIHHVATSIQVTNVIKMVSEDLDYSIERLYPRQMGREVPLKKQNRVEEDIPTEFEQSASPVLAEESGYLQAIDSEEMMRLATTHDLILRLEYRPGSFIVKGSLLALVWSGEQIDQKLLGHIRGLFILGHQRTQTQDVEYDINQLVEVAIRALSPAINDPFTAMMCTDRLGAALCELTRIEFPSAYRYDDNEKLRVITNKVDFPVLVSAAFNQIRQYGKDSVSVNIRLLEVIALVASRTRNEEQREALRRQAIMIKRSCHENIKEEWDQQAIEARFEKAMQRLEAPRFSQQRTG